MTATAQRESTSVDSEAIVIRPARTLLVVLAFAAIYLIWGSTYLAIRVAVQTLPPFSLAGARFLIAGAILYAFVAMRTGGKPRSREWLGAAIAGGLMLLGGNGAVMWAATFAPSGFIAVIVATVPLWMVVLPMFRGVWPRPLQVVGLIVGMLGVFWLLNPFAPKTPDASRETTSIYLWGGLLVTLGSMLWAAGSLYSRRAALPRDPLLSTAMQMLAGGAWLSIIGAAAGEWGRFDITRVSPAAVLAFVYLLLFGSLVAFTAYVWLLQVTSPAKVATYAYVNPVVAVLLGWLILREPLTTPMLIAMLLILASVAMVTTARSSRNSAARDTIRRKDAG